MEQRRKDIEGLTRTHGYTEEEAEVVYHLKVAQDRLAELYKRRFEGGPPGSIPAMRAGIARMAFVEPHFRALYAVLDGWVLERDYPDRLRRPHSEATDE
jgi:hypothetical protein